MSLEFVGNAEPDFLRVTASGDYSLENMFDFIDRVKAEADASQSKRALIDCRQIVGSMTDAERFFGGQRIAEVFGPRLRAAVVMPEGQLTKLGEMAAVNRGARFFGTTDETEAITWLMDA